MATKSAVGKASIAKAHQQYLSQSASAKKTGGSKTTLNYAGTSSNKPISGYTDPGDTAPVKPSVPTDNIDTGQPSPESVQVGAGLPGSPQATGNIPLNPQQQATYDAGIAKLKTGTSRFQQAQASVPPGTPPPKNYGEFNVAKDQYLAPKEDNSIVDAFMQEDKGFQEIKDTYADYYSSENQKTSLMDTYNKLYKKSGLDQLDEDIIDAQTIIDGTEDDIRNEIEQAGGFGTDSQVQALSLSRNKVLLKNYNQLVALRESKANNLDTMLNLAEKDRDYADKQVDRMFDYETKMLDYRDKFIQNARDQYNKYTPQQLNTLLAGNPRQLAFAEQILGLGQGGLTKLASAPLSEEDSLNLEYKRAQIANLKSEITKRNFEMSPTSGVDEKTMGKLQSAPEYKTITGVLPAMTAVKKYMDAVNESGSFEIFSGEKAGRLKSSYGNAIAAWKTLAALGALSGADFGLAENVIPEPSLFTRNSKVKSQLTSAIDNAISQADIMTRRLSQNYPKASSLLNQQLDDMKVTAYPDKFIYSPDGEVIELTD